MPSEKIESIEYNQDILPIISKIIEQNEQIIGLNSRIIEINNKLLSAFELPKAYLSTDALKYFQGFGNK